MFAKVLEAPGGLRIQTIHSFAQTLLASFPAEAGITPGFQPIEGRAEQELARTTLANLLADAEEHGGEQLIADVQCLSLRLGEEGAVSYLMLCARSADAMAAFGAPETIQPLIQRLMDLPEESVEDFLAHHLHDDRLDRELLEAIADANRRWGAQTGSGHAAAIEEWLSLTPIERVTDLQRLRKVVLTTEARPGYRPGRQKLRQTMRLMPGASRKWSVTCSASRMAHGWPGHGRRSARRSGLCAGLHSRQSGARAWPTSTT